MTGIAAWVLVGLGLAVVAVRQRGIAVGLVTAQALILVGLAVAEADGTNDLVAACALAARTLALGALFALLIRRTRDRRPVAAGLSPLRRAGLAAALAVTLACLVPNIGFESRTTERAVLALVSFGLVTAATSRATLLQVLGIVVIENALVVAALALPGTSWLIELGLAFDLTLLALVAGAFHQRIVAEFGAGDTGALRSLRD